MWAIHVTIRLLNITFFMMSKWYLSEITRVRGCNNECFYPRYTHGNTDEAVQLALLYRARAPLVQKWGLGTCRAGGTTVLPYYPLMSPPCSAACFYSSFSPQKCYRWIGSCISPPPCCLGPRVPLCTAALPASLLFSHTACCWGCTDGLFQDGEQGKVQVNISYLLALSFPEWTQQSVLTMLQFVNEQYASECFLFIHICSWSCREKGLINLCSQSLSQSQMWDIRGPVQLLICHQSSPNRSVRNVKY